MLRPVGLILIAVLLLVQPQLSHAALVTVALCGIAQYPCLPGNTVVSTVVGNGVGVLGSSQYTILPFTVTDAGVFTITGEMMATDAAGGFVYNWGTGTITDLTASAITVDVTLSQMFSMGAGLKNLNVAIQGNCSASPAPGAGSGAIAEGSVFLGATNQVLNSQTGTCATLPGGLTGATNNVVVAGNTTVQSGVEFNFAAGSAGSSITLPWGVDLPNFPTITGNPSFFNFVDPSHIPAGFTDAGPEPASFFLAGGSLALAGIIRRLVRK